VEAVLEEEVKLKLVETTVEGFVKENLVVLNTCSSVNWVVLIKASGFY